MKPIDIPIKYICPDYTSNWMQLHTTIIVDTLPLIMWRPEAKLLYETN